jgi:inosose dehydratase
MIKYGYEANGFVTYWWPQKATNTTMQTCIESLSELGYTGVELIGAWNQQIVAAYGTVDKFKEHLKSKKMELAGVYFNDMWHDRSRWPIIMATAQQLAAFLKECDCPNMVLGTPGRRYVGWVVTDKHLETMAECFHRMAALTLNYGVKPTLHPHYENLVETRAELDKIMALTEPDYVALCIDTAQLFIAGEDSLAAIEAYKDRINYLHFKDAKEVANRGTYGTKRYFYEVGQGQVDFPRIMEILKDMKYDGWVVIECDHPDLEPTPYESAKMTMDYINTVLSKIYK